ncbi:putative late blight resistance protein-like protein R1B-16 [Forsythia ovata]|uniref:Late blight resistance protein-like protein R1B-16 n=1 Tax=Forsythia ovata TaxID=205694 RepID=A0ABD1TR96_9LAMI
MTIVGSLPNLQVLKLNLISFVGLEWEPNEGEFLQLKYLLLREINLENWIANSNHFPSLEHLKRTEPSPDSLKQPASSSGKSSMVGLDDDIEKIKDWLTGGSSNLETLSVVGMGGIGKTTLTRKVYDDGFSVYHFHIRA